MNFIPYCKSMNIHFCESGSGLNYLKIEIKNEGN